ncbi:N-formylglutamate amidohydrolase [Roseibium sp. MMSF_3544]|uniref:N-formylglutamate amidohydrolase n=1 Tax=unclassified Roseibium TaxID=2629323 RepID=UPI00273E0546|nr:N-formylglutamate amidohydrolase [Roseibium sp. MMSF_3544]
MGASPQNGELARAVAVENADGAGAFVFVCDHASNYFPPPYDHSLGVSETEKSAHISWDPGALGVAKGLSERLDSPLVFATISRLIIDCNREEDRIDLIPSLSETTEIAGNRDLPETERSFRLDLVHRPFHKAIDKVIGERQERGLPTAVVSIHSYTPVYKGESRPWEIGLISDRDRRLADPIIAKLQERGDLTVGDNEPYAPSDGVYYTIRRHGEEQQLPCLMVEIRNNEITTEEEEAHWADLLAPLLASAVTETVPTGRAAKTGGADA